MSKTVIIADKQGITRLGIETLVNQTDKTKEVHQANSKKELIQVLALNSDVIVILDYTLFDFTGTEDLLNLSSKYSKSKWLLFSDELSVDFLRQVLYSDHSFSVVLKSCELEEISLAVFHLFRGERFICSRVTDQLLLSKKKVVAEENVLTSTEKLILKEIALGKTTKEIAAIRNLSFHTVITHRKNIFRKLEVNNVYEATKYAVRAGIIDVADYYI